MNLSQLHYFLKLAELQHYTNASKELFITQPSLSDSIRSLEKELGVPLFQKDGRGVKLTKYGDEFHFYVSSSLAKLERGITIMKNYAGNVSGTVDIGCIPTLLGDFLPDAISHYKSLHPQTTFNVYHGMSIELAEGVAAGKYDLGFCSMVESQPDLVFVPIMAQELMAVVNQTHPLSDRTEIGLEELKNYDLITYRENIPIGKVMRKLLKQHGVQASFSYDDELSIGGIISKSPLVAIAAKTPFLKQFDNLVLLTLSDVPKDTRLIYMVYSKKNFVTTTVETFADFIVAQKMNLPQSTCSGRD